MSAELEQVFSGAKHISSYERASLKPDTIEGLKCCKSMLRMRTFTDVKIIAIELGKILAKKKEKQSG